MLMVTALWIWQAANARSVIDRQFGVSEALQRAEQAVLAWHERYPGLGEPYQLSERLTLDSIRVLSGIAELPYAIELARTPARLTRNGIAYTEYTVSIRRVDGSTALIDPSTGKHQRTFTTEMVQAKLTASTRESMRALGARYEDYFASRARSDPSRDTGTNYFRPPSGDCAPTSEDVPCIDVFTSVSGAGLPAHLKSGISASDAWGRPFDLRNLLPAVNAFTPPFTLQLRAMPPGVADVTDLGAPAPTASPIVVTAIQRLE